MKVEDVIEQGQPCCGPDETLQQVAERMCLWGYDVLPVCRADRVLLGTITSRTVCLQACMSGQPLDRIHARDATSDQELCVRPEDDARDVVNQMVRERVWQLPVVDETHRLLGMVCYATLLREMSGTRNVLVIVPEVNALDAVQSHRELVPTWVLVTRPRELISPDGKPVQLSRAEAKLLMVLAENAGSVLDRDLLTRRVVQRAWHPTDRYVDVLVAHLRKKLGERGADARAIRTVPNDGYVLTLKVLDERGAKGSVKPVREPGQVRRRVGGVGGNGGTPQVSTLVGASS